MTQFNQYIEDQDNLELLDQQEIMAEWAEENNDSEIDWDTALVGTDKSFIAKINAKTNEIVETTEKPNKNSCKLTHLCETCDHSDYCFGEFKYEQN